MKVSHVARGETGAALQGQVDVCGGQDVYREFAEQLWAMTTKSIRALLNHPQICWRPLSGTLSLWWERLHRDVAPPAGSRINAERMFVQWPSDRSWIRKTQHGEDADGMMRRGLIGKPRAKGHMVTLDWVTWVILKGLQQSRAPWNN